MKTETVYIAEDGKRFKTESECAEHEKAVRKEKTADIQRTMCELDEKIWKKYYPDSTEEAGPEPHTAYIWLRNDIVHILTDENIDTQKAEKEILSIIKSAKHGEEILNRYVSIDDIREEACIRADYLSAFSCVENGSDLSCKISYTLGKNDLKQLAGLHRKNKCRKKIEDLLTACNFHYECGKFAGKEYDEFLERPLL